MKTFRVVSLFAMALVLLAGLALVRGRDSLRPPGVPRSSDGAVFNGETRVPVGSSDTPVILAKTVASGTGLNNVDERIAQLEAKIDRLEQRYRELETQQRRIAEQRERLSEDSGSPGVISGDDSVVGEDTANEVSDATTESENAFVQERIASLESELASQATDPIWTPKAVEQITEVFSNQALHGNTLQHIACTATLCRLEVMHTDEYSRNRFTDEFFPALEWRTNSFSHTVDNHDGSYNTALYLSREGYSLPPL